MPSEAAFAFFSFKNIVTMSTDKRDFREESLRILELPEGTTDFEILSALQKQMAEWHPDNLKFTDGESRQKAEELFKKLNELRIGLKLQKEQEKVANGIVLYSEEKAKEEAQFSAIYEVLDLKVKLLDAQNRLDYFEKQYEYEKKNNESLEAQLKDKSNSELREKLDDIKLLYQPKKSYKAISWSSLLALLIFQTKHVKSFLAESLGIESFYSNGILMVLAFFLLGIYLYKKLQLCYIEELIGVFTNPLNADSIDKGKWITTRYNAREHVIEESDFYAAISSHMQKSILAKALFITQKEAIQHQIADAVITDLLNKQILSVSYVYNGNRIFKMNDSDRIVRMDTDV